MKTLIFLTLLFCTTTAWACEDPDESLSPLLSALSIIEYAHSPDQLEQAESLLTQSVALNENHAIIALGTFRNFKTELGSQAWSKNNIKSYFIDLSNQGVGPASLLLATNIYGSKKHINEYQHYLLKSGKQSYPIAYQYYAEFLEGLELDIERVRPDLLPEIYKYYRKAVKGNCGQAFIDLASFIELYMPQNSDEVIPLLLLASNLTAHNHYWREQAIWLLCRKGYGKANQKRQEIRWCKK